MIFSTFVPVKTCISQETYISRETCKSHLNQQIQRV